MSDPLQLANDNTSGMSVATALAEWIAE